MIKRLLPLLALPLVASADPTPAATPAVIDGYSYVRSLGGINEYRLDSNGLQVLLMPDHSVPVLTFMVTYRVGSRNEVTGSTGSTHLLEHLMFKGTTNRDRAKGNNVDQLLERTGAQYNATTYLDRTNYYETLGSEHLAMVVEMEADRMRNLKLDDNDRKPEMTVVRNEFERGENSPFQALIKETYQAAYVAHPYHHSTIGWRSDIERVPIEKLRAFYDTFYWPDNATVTVIGDFKTEDALGLIKKFYGVYPKAPKPYPEMYTEEPEQTGQRRVTVKRAGQLGVVSVGFKNCSGLHDDWASVEILSNILTDGKNSRLYRALTDKGLTTNAVAFNGYFRDPSLCILFGALAPGATHEQVEKIIFEEVEKLKKDGVTQAEVDAAVAKQISDMAFQRDGSFAIAGQLNEHIATGDWRNFVLIGDKFRHVTPESVQSVANKYFNVDQSTVGWFIPLVPGGAAHPPAVAKRADDQPELNRPYFYRDDDEKPAGPLAVDGGISTGGAAGSSNIAAGVIRTKIDGVDVIAYKTGVKDVVYLRGSLPAGDDQDPANNPVLADLTSGMLDRGTTTHTKAEITSLLEAVGAEITFSNQTNAAEFSAKCLKKDVPLVISLLVEQLRHPAFTEEEFAKLKKQQMGGWKRALENTDFRATDEFTRAVYAPGHPNRQATPDEKIAAIDATKLDDVKKFHADHYGPNHLTIVAAGDVDLPAVQESLGKALEGWTGGAAPTAPARALRNDAPKETTVFLADKTSVSITFGQATGLHYGDPDYFALRTGTAILGSGFTGRLMGNVRDKEGLTYGIGAGLNRDSFTDGDWSITATFAPALLEKGIASTKRQLTNWYSNGVTADELERRKDNLIGGFKVSLATTNGIAQSLLLAVQRGKDVGWLDEYPQVIRSLTLQQVNGAIKKHLDPEKMVIVEAGTVPGVQPAATPTPEKK
ncbi:MAG TPA: pitrilysin family protein [Candidatus Didemnitutus sp.]|nr:pitrilysin family protein [Candidatus Didemnitutus sp.]